MEKKFGVVSADGHCRLMHLPVDLWTKRLPRKLQDDAPRVKRHVFFTFEVEEEGGFRRVPEIGLDTFLWASDFPGLDSPWPHAKAMGHAPAEAALGKEALDRLVFDNAVKLYQIPVAG